MAIFGGQAHSATVDITISCANPVVDIKQPNNVAVARVGAYDKPGKFLVQLLITNGSPTGPVVAGLTKDDFKVLVNNKPATVTSGAFIQEQYWLVVKAPTQTANGTYDLKVVLEKPGSNVEIASDTNTKSVVYASVNTDRIIVVDRSGSMGWNPPNRIVAAKAAANLYVDVTRDADGLAVVSFNDDATVDTTIGKASAKRTEAKSDINALSAGGWTSIGDGLDKAVDQRKASTTGSQKCSIVLLSDGMENTPLFWKDVESKVKNSGCPVISIAFGPESDETLMQKIATATGGSYFYNDVWVSSSTSLNSTTDLGSFADMALDLGSIYEYAQATDEGRQRLLSEKGSLEEYNVYTHTVQIDDSVTEALFLLDWAEPGFEPEMQLIKPDGSVIDEDITPYDIYDYSESYHIGWRIASPDPGEWQIVVHNYGYGNLDYQVIVSGPSNLTLFVLMPDRLGVEYVTGNGVPIAALLSGDEPILDALVQARIFAPDGSQTLLTLFDDGQHDDGVAGDGFYANTYTGVNQANPVLDPDDESIQPEDEGSYRVEVNAENAHMQRQALGSFAVLEDEDANGNNIPDQYEQEHGSTDPSADPDLDWLDNYNEYLEGTDPNNSDTDGGGENDGSEVLIHGLNPLDPSDDQIEAPGFFKTQAQNGSVLLTYDVLDEYVDIILYRAPSANGPWTEVFPHPDLSGNYTDSAISNDKTYYYRLMASDGENHFSAVLDGAPVTPREDPVLPEARILINGGAPSTTNIDVTLTFTPYPSTTDVDTSSFDDITEMLLSNDPFFAGAEWQAFAQDLPWTLAATESGYTHVYARFRDDQGNESIGTEVGTIWYEHQEWLTYLPITVKERK